MKITFCTRKFVQEADQNRLLTFVQIFVFLSNIIYDAHISFDEIDIKLNNLILEIYRYQKLKEEKEFRPD